MVALVVAVVLALAPGVQSAPAAGAVGGPNGVDQGDFQMPFPCGEVWGASTHASHPAVDWNGVDASSGSSDAGRPVLAGLGGTVFAVGGYHGYGTRVVVDHGDGWSSLYAHLSATTVEVGDVVTAVTQIGNVGNSGTSSGPHLHWEQRYLGQTVSPLWADGVVVETSYGSPGPTVQSHNCQPSSFRVSVVSPPAKIVGPPLVAAGTTACAPGGGCAHN